MVAHYARNQHSKAQQPSMANDSPRALVCLIEGESTPFRVEIAGNKDIMDLKKLIKEEEQISAPARNLTLWKVRMTLVVFCSDITDDTNLDYGEYPYHSICNSSQARWKSGSRAASCYVGFRF